MRERLYVAGKSESGHRSSQLLQGTNSIAVVPGFVGWRRVLLGRGGDYCTRTLGVGMPLRGSRPRVKVLARSPYALSGIIYR